MMRRVYPIVKAMDLTHEMFEDNDEGSVMDRFVNKYINRNEVGASCSFVPPVRTNLIAFPNKQEKEKVPAQNQQLVGEYPQPKQYVHMKLRFKRRNPDMEDVFHYFMREFDKDYPINYMRKKGETVRVCRKCGGVVWPRPSVRLTPSVMKRLALQCALRLKLDVFSGTCDGETDFQEYGG